MNRFGSGFVVLLLLLSLIAPLVSAQDGQWRTMGEIKTWHIQIGPSRVDVKLSSYADSGRPEDTVVSFALAEGDPILTVDQIASLLEKILNEMPGLGYKPEKLTRIAFPSWQTDLKSGMNRAVVSSGKWKKYCVGRYTCYAIEHVVSNYLRSSEALRPLESVLKMHNLERATASVDDPVCGFVPISTPQAVAIGKRSLSCGGLILVELRAIDTQK